MNDLLTDAELVEFTGCKQSSKQAKTLDMNGIYYFRRPDGKIRTTWHHFHNPYNHANGNSEPNFDAIDG